MRFQEELEGVRKCWEESRKVEESQKGLEGVERSWKEIRKV